jgi:hypothetical protein
MLREGNMARVGGGRLIKICSISHDVAECVWFDGRGQVHARDYEMRQLSPVWVSPKSLWPEINEMPDAVVAQLDAEAADRLRKKYRKPKLSKKLKRRGTREAHI